MGTNHNHAARKTRYTVGRKWPQRRLLKHRLLNASIHKPRLRWSPTSVRCRTWRTLDSGSMCGCLPHSWTPEHCDDDAKGYERATTTWKTTRSLWFRQLILGRHPTNALYSCRLSKRTASRSMWLRCWPMEWPRQNNVPSEIDCTTAERRSMLYSNWDGH
jgi:hypothetical protein